MNECKNESRLQTEVRIVGALRITLNHHSVKYLNRVWNLLNGYICRNGCYVASTPRKKGDKNGILSSVLVLMMFFCCIGKESYFSVVVHTYEKVSIAYTCRQRINSIHCSKQWHQSKENKCTSFHNAIFIMVGAGTFLRFVALVIVLSQVQFNNGSTAHTHTINELP